MAKRHLFLTGEIQVGKSTAIRRFLAESGKTADGFLSHIVSSVFECPELDNSVFLGEPKAHQFTAPRELYLARFDTLNGETDSQLAATNAGASANADGFAPFTIFTEIFDTHGAELVHSAGRRELILMDELGRMEERAEDFKRAVFDRLDGDFPILGVVKAVQTPFLDAVRAHPKVTVLTVTERNRNNIPRLISEMLPH